MNVADVVLQLDEAAVLAVVVQAEGSVRVSTPWRRVLLTAGLAEAAPRKPWEVQATALARAWHATRDPAARWMLANAGRELLAAWRDRRAPDPEVLAGDRSYEAPVIDLQFSVGRRCRARD